MGKLENFFKINLRGEQGGVVILVAVLLIVLLGITVLVIDVGALYLARREMVNAADATVLAAVLAKNQGQAKNTAEEYAGINGAVNFNKNNDVEFDGEIISVRVSRPVEFNFAQVLPGINEDSTLVSAIASAGKGPGNAIVPFVDVAWEFECPCYPDCTCPVDCECPPCECDEECICTPCECEADCPCEGEDECTCLYFEYDYQEYYIKNNEGDRPIQFKDRFQLKYERWQSWEYDTSGVFPYLRLGDLSGGSDLSGAIAGGYEGELKDLKTGTDHMAEPGGTGGEGGGPLIQGLESRLLMAGEVPCTIETLNTDINHETGYSNWYDCDLVVIMPLVVEKIHPKNFVIGGYATVLLDLEDGPEGKVAWAYFLEYLTYDDLEDLYPEGVLRNFTIRLIRHDSAFSN